MYTVSHGDHSLPRPSNDDEGLLRELFAARPLETYVAGRAIFWEADQADDVFMIVEGMVRLYRLLPDGRRIIVGFIFAGDVVGLSLQDEYLYTAEAVSQVRLRRLSKSQFYGRMAQSPALREIVSAHPRDEMCAAQDQMMLLLRRSADERVAAFLTFVAKHTGRSLDRGSEVHLPMSRTDIADYLGLTIETVSRSISKLRDKGVVKLDGPSRLKVEKPNTLHQLANGDEAMIDYVMSRIPPASRRPERLAV